MWSVSSAKKAVRNSKPFLFSLPLAFASTRLGKHKKKDGVFFLLLKDHLLQMKGITDVKKGEIKELFRNVLMKPHNLVSCKADGHSQNRPDHFFFTSNGKENSFPN